MCGHEFLRKVDYESTCLNTYSNVISSTGNDNNTAISIYADDTNVVVRSGRLYAYIATVTIM